MKTDFIRKIFNRVFASQLDELKSELAVIHRQKEELDVLLHSIDISVDVHEYDNRRSPSWAVISLQGKKADFIKFIELGDRDIHEIASFLRKYERRCNIKIDASPEASAFLKIR